MSLSLTGEVGNEMLHSLSMIKRWSYITSLKETGPSLMSMKRLAAPYPGIPYRGNVSRRMLVGGMAFLLAKIQFIVSQEFEQ
jgi:hypothetical protein